jgi:hypothetical protein
MTDLAHVLCDCGCCDGTGISAPRVIDNRPGLDTIAYRPGTHDAFKETMLARLSSADLPALADLTTRADDDLTIALLDAWAAVADVIGFYQEQIANEAYLRTATERRSLAALGELIGYVPRPGVAARAYLAFTIDDTGLEASVPIPIGTRVQSVPGPGEQPQTFETIEAISGRPELNAIRPRLTQPHPAVTTATAVITVQGNATGIAAGDSVLLVCGTASSDQVVKRALTVNADTVAETTRIELVDEPPEPPPFRFVALAAAPWRANLERLTSSAVLGNVLGGSWRQADLRAYAGVQRWSLSKLSLNIGALTRVQPAPLVPETGVFSFGQRPAIFGHNAPKYDSLPTPRPAPTSWENRTLSGEPNGANEIDLDTTYPGIVQGSWLVLDDGFIRTVYRVQSARDLSRADYTLAAKITRVRLSSSEHFTDYTLRGTSVLAQSARLTLAELPIADTVARDRIVLNGAYLQLVEGRPIAVSGERADLAGVTDTEIVTIADIVFSDGYTELVLATALTNEYVRATVTINANVAVATHGQSTGQAIGSGDATASFQEFVLPEAPLTHVAAAGPTGSVSTLAVTVNGRRWTEVPFLYGHAGDEHVYTTRQDDDGKTHVTFGDGTTGARLPTGIENVVAAYRKGMGAAGLVKHDQLTLMATRPLGVRGTTNPVDASDAVDSESGGDIRRNAALPIHTLDRIVSLQDYEDFARAFTAVAKALASWTFDGNRRGVLLTVAGPDGAAIASDSVTFTNLSAAIANAGDPAVPVRIVSFQPAFFLVGAAVGVDPSAAGAAVLAAVEAALRGAFGFAARAFGEPVAKSKVIATMQAVDGVVAVDLVTFRRTDVTRGDGPSALPALLAAAVPQPGADATTGAELLALDPRPVSLAVMTS